ncbi:alpha/beta hydrolase [Salinispira pacifica]
MEGADLGFKHRYLPGRDGETLLLLHGTGGSENDLLDIGRLLAPRAAILSPRGRVQENGLARFFRRISEGVFDIEDLRRQTDGLADFVADAARAYGFDPERVSAVGYSNGANIAASVLLLHPGVLSAAVLFHAMVPIVPERLPDLAKVPVFLGAGQNDTMIGPDQTEELAGLLRRSGAAVTLHWEPGGHALTRGEVEAAAKWLQGIKAGGPPVQ